MQAETFESDLARRVRMSSWLRPPYGISMRKRPGSRSARTNTHRLKLTRAAAYLKVKTYLELRDYSSKLRSKYMLKDFRM